MPEGQGQMVEMQINAKPSQRDDAARKNAGRAPNIAEMSIERRDVINPGQPSDQQEQGIECQPGLRANCRSKLQPKIFR